MNLFTFTGYLGRDCQRQATPTGTSVCRFTVAVECGYGDSSETMWVSCSLWGKRADGKLPNYLVKGTRVAISGEVSPNEYVGRDGKAKFNLQCNVGQLDLLTVPDRAKAPRQQINQNGPGGQLAQMQPAHDQFDDDIPF